MLFNSLHFLYFFPIIVFIFYSIPNKYRWAVLLLASYYFYMCWRVEYILLIIASTLIDYFTGLKLGAEKRPFKRKLFLSLSLFTNLGLLFTFKYFNFFSESVTIIFNHFNIFHNSITLHVLLPVGISFYTFQTLSYTIDVYRGKKEPERHIGYFALYVSFFPQLVAGPIERSTRLLPQFYKPVTFDYDRVKRGLQLMAWGFFKKVVIADRINPFVEQVYGAPELYSGIVMLFATYMFAFQIYCDFSGYSDIAIGSAGVLGYNLMQNFNRPYYSKSISEFWKRWHISLSTWFKDYLYISIGGNRVSRWRWYFNLFVVFIISGLWHGANWTFIVWGALHGFYLIFSIITQNIRLKIKQLLRLNSMPFLDKLIKVFITFHLVTFSWIFFRARSVSEAIYIISHIFSDLPHMNLSDLYNTFFSKIALLAIVCMETINFIQRKTSIRDWINGQPIIIRWSLYYSILIVIYLFGQFKEQKFIYFQF
ncbi:MBOAT family protein [candidate division KSB1 bacterium]|nr:MBOAT family protein [candidate division KSB1 bacterium]